MRKYSNITGCLFVAVALILLMTDIEAVFQKSGPHNFARLLPTPSLVLCLSGILLIGLSRFLNPGNNGRQCLSASAGLFAVFAGQRTMGPDNRFLPLSLLIAGLLLFLISVKKNLSDDRKARLPGRNLFILILIITISGGILRFQKLDQYPRGLLGDETLNLESMLELHTGRPFSASVGSKEFLFYFLGDLWLYLAEPEVISIRMLVALIGTLTIPLIFLLGRELFNDITGMTSALILALSPWHTAASRYAQRVNLSYLFIALCYYLWLLSRRKNKTSLFLTAGFLTGLGFHTWPVFKVVPFTVSYLFIIDMIKKEGRLKRATQYCVALVMFTTALLGPFLTSRENRRLIKYAVVAECSGKGAEDIHNIIENGKVIVNSIFGRMGRGNWYRPVYGIETPFNAVLIITGIFLACAGIKKQSNRLLIVIVAVHALPPLLCDYPHQRRITSLMIPFTLSAGLALTYWFRTISNDQSRKTGALFLIIGILIAIRCFSITTASYEYLPYEFDEWHAHIAKTEKNRSLFIESRSFQQAWARVMSYKRTGRSFDYYWGELPESLPLYVRSDRDVSVYFRKTPLEEMKAMTRRCYPHAEIIEIKNMENDGILGYEVRISKSDLKAAQREGLFSLQQDETKNNEFTFQPGNVIELHDKKFLPLDLRSSGSRWNDGHAWDLNFKAPFYGDHSEFRLDDTASGMTVIKDVPFFLIPESPVLTYSVASPLKNELLRSKRIILEQPFTAEKVHVLGLTSKWIKKKLRPSAVITLDHPDGTQYPIKLYAKYWTMAARQLRQPAYKTELAFRHRSVYLDKAEFSLDKNFVVHSITLSNLDDFESMIIAAITLESP